MRHRTDIAGKEAGKGGLKWDEIRKALIDPNIYLTAILVCACENLMCADGCPQAKFFCSNVAFRFSFCYLYAEVSRGCNNTMVGFAENQSQIEWLGNHGRKGRFKCVDIYSISPGIRVRVNNEALISTERKEKAG